MWKFDTHIHTSAYKQTGMHPQTDRQTETNHPVPLKETSGVAKLTCNQKADISITTVHDSELQLPLHLKISAQLYARGESKEQQDSGVVTAHATRRLDKAT